ncbi:MAG: 3-oxoacyl-ACP reductase FabG [Clostridiaceae bacterium]|nr:3-oxoacyl-ACP reductase FabG [Clostridiaceae bacterium]
MSKTVIVTGGSKGIGSAIVKLLAEERYNIVLNYNKSESEAKKIQKEFTEKGYIVEIFKADVSKREEVKKLVDFAIEKFKKIDVLINNAGITQTKLFTDITEKDWNTMMNVNLNSVFYMSQEVISYMIKQKEGLIINISSIWALTGSSCEVHYSVAKAGVDAMTKSLAKELGPSNIRVNSIAPGIIDTDMNKHLSEKEIKNIEEEIPLEKIGKTYDIAKCVKWLIEDEYTTGQIISINGGWNI